MLFVSKFVAAKNPVHPRKNTAEGGCGGNSAVFLQKIEASPAALLVKAMHHRKILFSLREEKIGRAQNEKSKEYFSVVRRVVASGGGAERQNSAFGAKLYVVSLLPLRFAPRQVDCIVFAKIFWV